MAAINSAKNVACAHSVSAPLIQDKLPGLKPTGRKAVGCTVDIWWDGDKTYYRATVMNYNKQKNVHQIKYISDNFVEELDLSDENVVFLKPKKRKEKRKKLPRKLPIKRCFLPKQNSPRAAALLCGKILPKNLLVLMH